MTGILTTGKTLKTSIKV